MATTTDSFAVSIKTDRIQPDPDNVRSRVSIPAVESLAKSIKGIGLQQPIVVRPFDDGYRVIAGHRRLAAINMLKDAGEHTGHLIEGKDVIIRLGDLSASDVLVSQLVENLQREDIDVLDEAAGYMRLLEFDMSQADISRKVGRTRSHITKRLALLTLPQEAKVKLTKGDITIEHALAIAALDAEDQEEYVKEGRWDDYALGRLLRKAKGRKAVAKMATDLQAIEGMELRPDTGDIHTQPAPEAKRWETVEVVYGGSWDPVADGVDKEATMAIVRSSGEQAMAHLYKLVEVTEAEGSDPAAKREARAKQKEKEAKAQERALRRAEVDFLTHSLARVKTTDANDLAMEFVLDSLGFSNSREVCAFLDLEVEVKVEKQYDGSTRNVKDYWGAARSFVADARENGDIGNLRRMVVALAATTHRQRVLDRYGFDPNVDDA